MSNIDPIDNQFTNAPAIASLVATVGTADGTLADVTAAFSQAVLNNNFRDLADKVNEIITALRTADIIPGA